MIPNPFDWFFKKPAPPTIVPATPLPQPPPLLCSGSVWRQGQQLGPMFGVMIGSGMIGSGIMSFLPPRTIMDGRIGP